LHIFTKMVDSGKIICQVLDEILYTTDARIRAGASLTEVNGRIIHFSKLIEVAEAHQKVNTEPYKQLMHECWGIEYLSPQSNNVEATQ
jgi:hypothetical protein